VGVVSWKKFLRYLVGLVGELKAIAKCALHGLRLIIVLATLYSQKDYRKKKSV
jgi:hypothetical protein